MQRRPLLGALTLGSLVPGFAPAQAPAYPARPVKVVVAFTAGGTTDILARAVAQKLGDSLKQPFVIDNKVDFSDNANLIVAAVTLVLGTGDFTLKFGGFALGGIGTATFGAILLYALLGRRSR